MTAKPALHKPIPSRPPEPKPRSAGNTGSESPQPTTRFERREHEPSETRHEGELFEAMMSSSSDIGFWGGGDLQQTLPDPWRDGERQGGHAGTPPSPVTPLWDPLIEPIEEHLNADDQMPMEATFELPELGKVVVQVVPRADGLDIALRFAKDIALQRCQEYREASREWLSQRLGRRIRLTLGQADQ
ncbi:type III secretion system HrpP C-terminal domain-containing protein [Pseudomonas alliivorans]|nr:type III secretion system HrpP C-terminal domain-containing protein [Pseudomonas alliivorans]